MRKKLLLLTILLQPLFLIGLIATQEWGLRKGTLVTLETMPVDPRDLLRGDYVILNYKISNIPSPMFNDHDEERCKKMSGEKVDVYVLLEPSGPYYEAVRASYQKLSPVDGQVLIKGTENYCYFQTHEIDYGLERYYVPEGTGIIPRDKKITVQAAITNSGLATVKELFVDGKPFNDYINEQKTNPTQR